MSRVLKWKQRWTLSTVSPGETMNFWTWSNLNFPKTLHRSSATCYSNRLLLSDSLSNYSCLAKASFMLPTLLKTVNNLHILFFSFPFKKPWFPLMGHYLSCYPNLCTTKCSSLLPNKCFYLIINYLLIILDWQVHTLFSFTSCYPMSFFHSRIPSRIPHYSISK